MAEKNETKIRSGGGHRRDLFICLLLAAGTTGLQFLWSFPGIYPALWEKVAIAAGLRPAEGLLNGYWLLLADLVFRVLGAGFGTLALRFAGHVALGFVAVLAYGVLREALAFLIRVRPQLSPNRTGVMRLASALGAAAFVAADPVWTAGQFFGPVLLHTMLALAATKFFLSFLRRGTLSRAYLGALLLGLLIAATPFGVVLLGFFIAVGVMVTRTKRNSRKVVVTGFVRPLVLVIGRWHITFLAFFGVILGMAANMAVFALHDGLAATGLALGNLPLAYLTEYWALVSGGIPLSGWLVWAGVCLVPFVISVLRFPSAVDEEQLLSYASGFVFVFCGLLALTPSGPLSILWFWTHVPVNADLMLVGGLFLCAVTVACTVTVFGIDAHCRNHSLLLQRQFSGADGDDLPYEMFSDRVVDRLRRPIVAVVSVLAFAAMVPARMNVATRAMLAVIDDAARAVIEQAQGVEFLFTDGRLDALLELHAKAGGQTLRCLSLFGGSSSRARYIRERGLGDDREDVFSFGHDAGTGLRCWVRDRPGKLTNCAVQVGFDLWRRDCLPLPPVGGLLARPGGWRDDAVRTAGVETARALAVRAGETLPRRRIFGAAVDPVVNRAFDAVVWRLARMCRVRGDWEEQEGRPERASAEAEGARRLDRICATYRRLAADQARARQALLKRFTVREGLYLALVRADFVTGRLYAETVLATEPDDPDANFVMGMSCLKARQLARAETYLKRCLIRRPDESVVHNNLAMVQLERGKIAAAENSIARALKIHPGAAALLDTARRVKEAKKKGKGK